MIRESRAQQVKPKQGKPHHQPKTSPKFFCRELFGRQIEVPTDCRQHDGQRPGDQVILDDPKVLPGEDEGVKKDQHIAELDTTTHACVSFSKERTWLFDASCHSAVSVSRLFLPHDSVYGLASYFD